MTAVHVRHEISSPAQARGVAGSTPTEGMGVCVSLSSVFVVLRRQWYVTARLRQSKEQHQLSVKFQNRFCVGTDEFLRYEKIQIEPILTPIYFSVSILILATGTRPKHA